MTAVLYIEDNEDNIILVQRVLALRSGVELTVATTGREGLRLAADIVPDLILLDWRLPDVPGLDVLTQLRTRPGTAAIPVVVLSGDSHNEHAAKLRRLGVHDFLAKPFDIQRLLTIVDRFSN